jgi:hypothetical protein
MPGVSAISSLSRIFTPASSGLAAHDCGINLGEEVRHHGFTFFVDDQKIEIAVAPRNITVKADSESRITFLDMPPEGPSRASASVSRRST